VQRPCCGTTSISPSALTKARCMLRLASARCTAMPTPASGSPLTAMVCRPSTKSSDWVSGTGSACQRSGSGGVGTPSAAPVFSVACASGSQAPGAHAGPRRYIQVRRFSARGAVKAAARQQLGIQAHGHALRAVAALRQAPGSASLANWLPMPVW
jgi:hypothetical protein